MTNTNDRPTSTAVRDAVTSIRGLAERAARQVRLRLVGYHSPPRRLVRKSMRRAHGVLLRLPLGERVNTALTKRAISSPHRQKYVPTEALSEVFTTALEDLADSGVTDPAYFEAGVFAGDSLATYAGASAASGRTLRAFAADSFRGLPPTVEKDEGNWEQGQFRCPRAVTEWNLDRLGVDLDCVELIEGWFDETLTAELAARVGTVHVAMLDADSYSSTVPVLDFLTPLFADRAWLIFDDWYSGGNYDPSTQSSRGTGVERAYLEWLERNPGFELTDRGDYELDWRGQPNMAGKVFLLQRHSPRGVAGEPETHRVPDPSENVPATTD